MILKVLIIFDPKLNLFKSDAYIFMQQSPSESEMGQIYIPFLNWLLFISIIAVVLLFKSSSNLAGAYGLAVTVTMFCDTLLVGFLAYSYWKWKTWKLILFIVPFVVIDLVLLSSNLLKFFIGGWMPVVVALIVFTLMMIWKRGRGELQAKLQSDTLPLDMFIQHVDDSVNKVTGTAVFLTGTPNVVPHALLHNLKHNKILHERNVLVTVDVQDIPYVSKDDRFLVEQLELNFFRIKLNYGFKEQPNLPIELEAVFDAYHIEFNLMEISFFVSRERIISKQNKLLDKWREQIFSSMHKNTRVC